MERASEPAVNITHDLELELDVSFLVFLMAATKVEKEWLSLTKQPWVSCKIYCWKLIKLRNLKKNKG